MKAESDIMLFWIMTYSREHERNKESASHECVSEWQYSMISVLSIWVCALGIIFVYKPVTQSHLGNLRVAIAQALEWCLIAVNTTEPSIKYSFIKKGAQSRLVGQYHRQNDPQASFVSQYRWKL